ncbi:unnamed protein product [Knipowitschia caucasica]|uniref:C2H2-type domain-containing protein n=1 Tax=Knipowitschia caucasica TaxID=637954 RepID=A0AAV2MLF8_KNICA
MTKLDLLNVFLNDRLTAAAQDIFRAIKETVLEYQGELVCVREENERLRQLLDATVQRLLLRPESRPGQFPEVEECLGRDWRCAKKQVPYVKEEQPEEEPPEEEPPEEEPPEEEPPEEEPPEEEPPKEEPREKAIAACDSLFAVGQIKTEESTHTSSHWSANSANSDNPAHPWPRPLEPVNSLHKWHSCVECGKNFNFACQLEVHMRWHTKEKPYACAVCRKSFTTASMLNRHHRIHTGEKPFHCHVCGKSFNQSAHLNTHFRLHLRERHRERHREDHRENHRGDHRGDHREDHRKNNREDHREDHRGRGGLSAALCK